MSDYFWLLEHFNVTPIYFITCFFKLLFFYCGKSKNKT